MARERRGGEVEAKDDGEDCSAVEPSDSVPCVGGLALQDGGGWQAPPDDEEDRCAVGGRGDGAC
eukprot:1676464-Rhodomonas_salina.1